MPTRAQVLAYLQQMRAATPQDPITHTSVADYLESLLNHLTNSGGWDPATVMAQVASLTATYPDRFQSLETTIYVDYAAGNDANLGTQASPIKTFTRLAQIVNNKFYRVAVNFLSNYTHDGVDVSITVPEIFLFMNGKSITFKKRINISDGTNIVGQGSYYIIFNSSLVNILGTYTVWDTAAHAHLIVEGHTGATGVGDIYYYNAYNGAIRLRQPDFFTFKPIRIVVSGCSLRPGNNTTLFSGDMGGLNNNSNALAMYFEQFCSRVLGTNATEKVNFHGPQVRNYTPASSTDPKVNDNEMTYDSNFLYIKIAGTIKKVALTAF